MKINLKYDMIGAFKKGISIHPQSQMKALGINYSMAIPQSIADQWWFYDCENIPNPLPSFLSILVK